MTIYFYCTQCDYADETLSDLEEYRSGMGCPSCGLGPIRPIGKEPEGTWPSRYEAKTTSWYCVVDQQKVIEVITYPIHKGNTALTIGIRDVALRGQGHGPVLFRPRSLVKPTREEAIEAARSDLLRFIESTHLAISELLGEINDAKALLNT